MEDTQKEPQETRVKLFLVNSTLYSSPLLQTKRVARGGRGGGGASNLRRGALPTPPPSPDLHTIRACAWWWCWRDRLPTTQAGIAYKVQNKYKKFR